MSNGPTVLIEQANTRYTMIAVVEQDERTAYFYLYPAELQSKKYRMRACWLRNLQPGPSKRDSAAMENGDAPMLEAHYCNHPQGKEPLQADRLSIVWMPEEDGAAVLYDGETLGVIPGWSLYSEDPAAYAADCTGGDGDALVFPLGDASKNQQHARVAEAVTFRKLWDDTETPQWPVIQDQFINIYQQHFGELKQYFAIDNNQWPPMALGKFEKDNVVYFLTMGVSIRPMPWVSYLYNDHAPAYRRMELALAISKDDFSEEEITKMAEGLSGMADIPWRHISWLGEGHTIGSAKLPAPFESIVLSAALYNGEGIEMPEMYGDKVNLFWASPVTLTERQYAHEKANGGYELLEKMIQADITHIVRKRDAIV
ncbi:suppressor of fused domain protein [Chitinophaga rhizophila]|uniref:Suppressor of fused domain protein n=1 Tax=Chitinophaga rhizophila TaxID=2866212 RepID=A0ABS7GB46_9BACT|nr:suppressor of fused domain protein [Chitinophaga rhizophila]MBW8684556.1 suppressor of fused domain protein [Chitinophaga rhizophila]